MIYFKWKKKAPNHYITFVIPSVKTKVLLETHKGISRK